MHKIFGTTRNIKKKRIECGSHPTWQIQWDKAFCSSILLIPLYKIVRGMHTKGENHIVLCVRMWKVLYAMRWREMATAYKKYIFVHTHRNQVMHDIQIKFVSVLVFFLFMPLLTLFYLPFQLICAFICVWIEKSNKNFSQKRFRAEVLFDESRMGSVFIVFSLFSFSLRWIVNVLVCK